MTETKLHDGSTIEIEIYGEGPNILLPVNPRPIEGQQAEELRKYGADPALGQALIKGLSDKFRVIAFDYEGHVLKNPKALTLTPDNVMSDFLAVADAAKADLFAYYGYSWLAMVGIQLALKTKRLSALMIGGFPPIDGPYKEMLKVTTASYDIARGVTTSPNDEWSGEGLGIEATQQFVTLYQALQEFDDRAAQAQINCPRLCIVGATDNIEYGEGWGEVYVNIAERIINGKAELEKLGWDVHVFDGLNHMGAMQAAQVIPIVHPWLISKLVSQP